MKPLDPTMADACQAALNALAGADDEAAALALVGLLRWPEHTVAMWFAAAVLELAVGVPDEVLADVTSRRMPEAGAVARIVEALRRHDGVTLLQDTGVGPTTLFVPLAAAATTLMGVTAA